MEGKQRGPGTRAMGTRDAESVKEFSTVARASGEAVAGRADNGGQCDACTYGRRVFRFPQYIDCARRGVVVIAPGDGYQYWKGRADKERMDGRQTPGHARA